MKITRREALGLLAASPLAAGGCCTATYPVRPNISVAPTAVTTIRPLLAPTAPTVPGVIDAHAHFFNASDLPVRGFLVDCIGHTRSKTVRWLLRRLSPIADALAAIAPTAEKELRHLNSLVLNTSVLGPEEARLKVLAAVEAQREATFGDVAKVIRGSEFESAIRLLRSRGVKRAMGGQLSADQIREVVDASETPSQSRPAVSNPGDQADRDALEADGVLRFLCYFLSYRSNNIASYQKAFCRSGGLPSVDMVLGSLVDFDYCLDCPPRSSHEDQIALYKLLACLHGGFFKPVVAYNPWTDINQNNAGLDRVKQAKLDAFVAVKIYPPVGFKPAGNKAAKINDALAVFFSTCADIKMPVIAHAEHTNGKDANHDDFSSPTVWREFLNTYPSGLTPPVIDFGHFGGGGADKEVHWTKEFATLMGEFPRARLFGDLGYWVDFMSDPNCERYRKAKDRLEHALAVTVGDKTVADRVMFGSDWLMLSQVDRWSDYLDNVDKAIRSIASEEVTGKIFAGNARDCFGLTAA